ncbi:DUF4407 domain-containing protein [Daejeonella sp.]|jgi:hypothetical protein|uniref:DUF4407 domain-containing protein n=1 Tax=Daejeonella sp. TaxID=2805397 RepID=UPI003784AB29
MNQTDNYQFNNNKLTRFFWWCAGADERLLDEKCPPSDHVKYFCLGGIVAATGLLAFLSSSYAFYTVFGPKGQDAMDMVINTEWIIISIIMGTIWGYIIFNLDRFIISSTGKGDGKDTISWSEFGNSIPRLIMALILGIVISAPLETRILKTEIDAELSLKQEKYLDKLNTTTDSLLDKQIATWQAKIDPLQKNIDTQKGYTETRRLEIKEQRRLLELEAEGKTGTGTPGRGPAYRDKKENLDKMELELNILSANSIRNDTQSRKEIEKYKLEISTIDNQRNLKRAENIKRAQNLDGLLERIKISHEIGGWIPWFILGMFLCIEMGPILFKLMMSKTPYDYLSEYDKELRKAKAGILVISNAHRDVNGKEVEIVRYLDAEKEIDKFTKELEVNKHQLNVWGQQTTKKISANPENYL